MPHRSPAWLKPLVDYGPLGAFFAAYLSAGLMTATGVLMAATAVVLALSLYFERRLPVLPLVTAAVVGVFGGLTLWLNDETFIKLKPTIIQGVMAAVLFGGLAVGRPLLKPVMGSAWRMDEAGWRRLTLRFAVFFTVMAGLNELVWRTQSTDVWVTFKVFGILVLTFLFALAQTPLMQRHHLPDEAAEAEGDG